MKKTAQEMENYMKNDLSKEEAELIKKKYGPNCLPEQSKHPGSIFLHEISSAFSLLLWICISF